MDTFDLYFYKYFIESLVLFKFLFLLIFAFSFLFSIFSFFNNEKFNIYLWLNVSAISIIQYYLLRYLPYMFYLLVLY
jgi:hypothetical protein